MKQAYLGKRTTTMASINSISLILVLFQMIFRGVVAPPPLGTDSYVSQCGFLEDPIVVLPPPPPSPPPSSPSSSPLPNPLKNPPPTKTTPPPSPPPPNPPRSPPPMNSPPPPNPPPFNPPSSPPSQNPPSLPPPFPPRPPPLSPPNPPPPSPPKSPPPPTPPPPPSPFPPTPPPPGQCAPLNSAAPPSCLTELSLRCGGIIPKFILEPGVKYVGGDIRSTMEASSSYSCASACLNMTNCFAFSHGSDGSCAFKNSSTQRVASPGFDSWALCNSSPAGQSASRTGQQKVLRRRLLQKQAPAAELWSNPQTWPGGVVPGIGSAAGANATIPCGRVVVLDVANLTLGLLRVQGLLKFLDDPSLPLISVKANFILVEGQLFIGSSTRQFRQKAIIELTPNPNARKTLLYTYSLPAEPAYPRNFGHKAFVIVGGQVRLHGLPGPRDMPVWVRLSKDANVNDTSIQVDADVAQSWPVGGKIVVTTTDYDWQQSETFQIVKVSSTGNGMSTITVDLPFKFKHYGTINGLSDGLGGFLEQRAEVALLTRNIVITGTDEPAPYNLEGGHLMVFMTKYPPQHIEGVEFFNMGQQGALGRYPIHFHIMGAVPGTVCRKNAIHKSKQRCIVIHATHNLTIESNVAYDNFGHCFILEEGGEENNTFVNNLGIATKSVSVRISNDESDNSASIFWITNLKNSYIGNVAAGSSRSGFWVELRPGVRGDSTKIPGLNTTAPRYGTMTLFLNNTAHSNDDIGLRTYPFGFIPRVSQTRFGPRNVFDGMNIYKNKWTGMFIHNSDSVVIKNSVFSDNGRGVDMNSVFRVQISNTRFIGLSDNYGNPSKCWESKSSTDCMAVSFKDSCTLPLKSGLEGRSTGGRNRYIPSYGIVMDEGAPWYLFSYTFTNLSFSNYDPTCSIYAGFVIHGARSYWSPALSVEGIRYTSNSLPFWTPPQLVNLPYNAPLNHGEQTRFHMFYDKDGSFNNGIPSMILTNQSEVLPPGLKNCTPKPASNAYACTGVCYRTLVVAYPEVDFFANANNYFNTRANFSYLRVTRLSDGSQFTLNGNMQDGTPENNARQYLMNILASQIYLVEIVPPSNKASWIPPNDVTLEVRDVGSCTEGLTVRLKQEPKTPWKLASTDVIYPTLCPGSQPFTQDKAFAQYSPVCVNNESFIEISLSSGLRSAITEMAGNIIPIHLVKGNTSDGEVCPVSFPCSLVWSGTDWHYDDSGLERRPAFYNPILSKPENWKTGRATFGAAGSMTGQIETFVAYPEPSKLVTYYFRKTFSLTNVGCYSALYLDIIVNDGLVLYINNAEALRINLSPGYLDNKTNALAKRTWMTWESFVVPITSSSPFSLVEGTNTIAVEEHIAGNSGVVAFEMRVTATRNASCTAVQTPRPEVCDGLDNDLDGTVDLDASGKLLTKPCSTVCGVGIMTCINGFFQQCSAVAPSAEVCDGKDNNCDGIIDNGRNQLDCPAESVCFGGSCRAAFPATSTVTVWPRNSSGWSYHDKGTDLDATAPWWRTGNSSETWPTGKAPLGFDLRSPRPTWQILGTNISNFLAPKKTVTAYFAKSFNLTAADVTKTFNLDLAVRRVDGVVVYMNGAEIWRDNMPQGKILASNGALTAVSTAQEAGYFNCTNCRRNNSALLKTGSNFIVAELHTNSLSRTTSAFDLELYRNVIIGCPLTAANCVRKISQPIMNAGSTWKYLDGSLSLPTSDSWMSLDYDDSSWLTGPAPLGFGASSLKTAVNNGSVAASEPRRTLYFRQWLNLPEGSCYVSVLVSLLAKDGGALYINGVEATRNGVPPGSLNSTVYAASSSSAWLSPVSLSGGWLKTGLNLFAVEVHRVNKVSSLIFDFSAVGVREGISCGPDPTLVSVPRNFLRV